MTEEPIIAVMARNYVERCYEFLADQQERVRRAKDET